MIAKEILTQILEIKKACSILKPIVAIRCTAYNHSLYLRDALEGFVIQNTKFPFVAIVHDDASTDSTRLIIEEYAEKFPNIIMPLYETENQYSKRDGSLRKIIDSVSILTGAKYYALCEGDDYWTDPLKLQKQVDFLERNPTYSMCFHNAFEKWEFGNHNSGLFSKIKDKDYQGEELFKNWIVPTASVVFHSSVILSNFYKKTINHPKFLFGDIVIFCICARLGKVRGMSDIMSVYRRNEYSVTNVKHSNEYISKLIEHNETLANIFGQKYIQIAKIKYVNLYGSLALRNIVKKNFKMAFYYIKLANNKSSWLLFKYLGNFIIRYISNAFKQKHVNF